MRLPVIAFCSAALSLYACSDDPASSTTGVAGSVSGGTAGKATGGANGLGGTINKGGSGGTLPAGGKGGSAGSGTAEGGAGEGGAGGAGEGGMGEGGMGEGGTGEGGTGEGGTGGAAPAPDAQAQITLVATTGNTLVGTVLFEQFGAKVTMTMTVTGCPEGAHPMHLHTANVCGDDGALALGHWGDVGGPGEGGATDGLSTIACDAAGNGSYTFSPVDGTWTIGGAEATNILPHVMVVHAVGASTRLSCGLPVLL